MGIGFTHFYTDDVPSQAIFYESTLKFEKFNKPVLQGVEAVSHQRFDHQLFVFLRIQLLINTLQIP